MALDLEAARRWAAEASTGVERQLAHTILALVEEVERLRKDRDEWRQSSAIVSEWKRKYRERADAAEADAALLSEHLRRWPHQHYGVDCSICEALALHDARLTEREGE